MDTKIQRIYVTRQLSLSRVGVNYPQTTERLNTCSLQYERASRSRRDETLIIFRGPNHFNPSTNLVYTARCPSSTITPFVVR